MVEQLQGLSAELRSKVSMEDAFLAEQTLRYRDDVRQAVDKSLALIWVVAKEAGSQKIGSDRAMELILQMGQDRDGHPSLWDLLIERWSQTSKVLLEYRGAEPSRRLRLTPVLKSRFLI